MGKYDSQISVIFITNEYKSDNIFISNEDDRGWVFPMEHSTLMSVILDQRELIQKVKIVKRDYFFEPEMNHVLTGLRRAGKTFLMYQHVLELIDQGVSWDQIIFINFEDDRLFGFSLSDCSDIVVTASEMTDDEPYYFFDEIQNVDGWERFARRLADQKAHIFITGSNAKMLSSEIESRLGGRFLTHYISPYRFPEYLTARDISFERNDLLKSASQGKIRQAANDYRITGGFPETIRIISPREYVQSVFHKILFNDIALRNGIRRSDELHLSIKKIAESCGSELSYTRIRKLLNTIGYKISLNTVIDYINYMKDGYLLYSISNFTDKFAQREMNRKYYFLDNGLLRLFVDERDTGLIENAVAVSLYPKWKDELYYLKSAASKIDLDFYLPERNTAIQVCQEINSFDMDRELDSLIRLAKREEKEQNLLIVTAEQEQKIEREGFLIWCIPLWKFLLDPESYVSTGQG